MWAGPDHPVLLVLLLSAVPVTIVAVTVAVIAVLALAARRPATRRHCIEIMRVLAQVLRTLRGAR